MIRILVVEDEAYLARMIARVLGEEGYAAETAEMGSTGLTRGLSEQFDLLIVDWMLPDLDGIQVVRGLRSAEVNVPILMLANSQSGDPPYMEAPCAITPKSPSDSAA